MIPPELRQRDTYRVAPDPGTNNLYMIVVEEGWRQTVLCWGMYEWAANWLVRILAHHPFTPEGRP